MNGNWIKLKDYILTKNSHGKNELLHKMVELEINSVDTRMSRLQSGLKEAVLLLREGKHSYPDVDSFLERHSELVNN
jgi:hypothetical protein